MCDVLVFCVMMCYDVIFDVFFVMVFDDEVCDDDDFDVFVVVGSFDDDVDVDDFDDGYGLDLMGDVVDCVCFVLLNEFEWEEIMFECVDV